jgi:hypothetical protein
VTNSDWIAYASALVAILSAIYSYRAVNEAKKANALSLFHHRKEIYDAFYELKMHMVAYGESSDIKIVSKFYHHSRDANIYFSEPLGSLINEYFGICFDVAIFNAKRGGNLSESSQEIESKYDRTFELEKAIQKRLLLVLRVAKNA